MLHKLGSLFPLSSAANGSDQCSPPCTDSFDFSINALSSPSVTAQCSEQRERTTRSLRKDKKEIKRRRKSYVRGNISLSSAPWLQSNSLGGRKQNHVSEPHNKAWRPASRQEKGWLDGSHCVLLGVQARVCLFVWCTYRAHEHMRTRSMCNDVTLLDRACLWFRQPYSDSIWHLKLQPAFWGLSRQLLNNQMTIQ